MSVSFHGMTQKKGTNEKCKRSINFAFWTKERGAIPRYVVGKIKRAKENNFFILVGASKYDLYSVEGFYTEDSKLMSAYFIINRQNGKREKFPLFENRDMSNAKIKSDSGNNLLDQCYDRLMDLSRRNIFNQRLIKPIYFNNNNNSLNWTLKINHPSGKTHIWNYITKKNKDNSCSFELKTKVINTKKSDVSAQKKK